MDIIFTMLLLCALYPHPLTLLLLGKHFLVLSKAKRTCHFPSTFEKEVDTFEERK